MIYSKTILLFIMNFAEVR